MPEQPLVSVVTPVYNGAAHLGAAIESVLAQHYPRWEYLIVDNQSGDASLEIAQHYAARDARIRVISQPQYLPMIQNWNAALREISPASRYSKVLHADDLLFPECLERMVALAEAHPNVGLVGAYRLRGSSVDLAGMPYPAEVAAGQQIARQVLLEQWHLFGSPTATLIRSDLLRERQPFYNEQNPHADTEACFALLQHSDWGFVHQVLTYTRIHPEQNTTRASMLKSHLVGHLLILLRYGPVYLSRAEYDQQIVYWLHQYDRVLARGFLHRKGQDFWRFHQGIARQLGYPLDAKRLAYALGDLLAERLFGKLRLAALYRRWSQPLRARPAQRVCLLPSTFSY